MNLFDDAKLSVVIDRYETMRDVRVFYGHVEGDDELMVLIAHRDDTIAARIRGPDGRIFYVGYVGDGIHRICELDPLKLRDVVQDDVLSESKELQPVVEATRPGAIASRTITTPPVIDVMILYTTEEKDMLGGQAATEARIALSVAYANEAFRRSFVDARLQLVHIEEVTSEWHQPTHTALGELSWVAFDPVVAQRQASYGADLVSLLSYFTDWGGMAYCSDYWSVYCHYPEHFTHEVGHSFGCNHERDCSFPPYCGSQDYNYGYHFTSPVDGVHYGTIMSYQGFYSDLFSNPTNYFRGAATGIPEGLTDAADNARQLNSAAAGVASRRSPAVTVLSSPALINNGTQFSFQIVGPNSGVYRVEYTSDYASWSTLGDYTLSSGNVAMADSIGNSPYRFYRARLGSAYLGTQIGYIKMTVPAGFSMIGNQLDNGDNTFDALFPLGSVPEGTTAYKYDEQANPPGYVIKSYVSGEWTYPWMTLRPGEGVLFQPPTAVNLAFVGEVLPAFNRRVRTGFSIQSSAVPQAGLVTSVLRFPGVAPDGESISAGDVAYRMINTAGDYQMFTWSGTAWTPSEPVMGIGEAFWSNKQNQTGYWKRVFWTWP